MTSSARSMLDDINASLVFSGEGDHQSSAWRNATTTEKSGNTSSSMRYTHTQPPQAQPPVKIEDDQSMHYYGNSSSLRGGRPSGTLDTSTGGVGFSELWYQNRSPPTKGQAPPPPPSQRVVSNEDDTVIPPSSSSSAFKNYKYPTYHHPMSQQQVFSSGVAYGDDDTGMRQSQQNRTATSGRYHEDHNHYYHSRNPSTGPRRNSLSSSSIEQNQLIQPQGTDPAAYALDSLTGELDNLRRNWREDGSKVRQKMIQFHRGKVKAEEKLAEVESTFEQKTREWEHERAAYQQEIDRLKSTVRHLVHENDQSREERYTQTGTVQSKLSSALRRVATLENELADERARRINANGETEHYNYQLEASQRKIEELQNQIQQLTDKAERDRKALLDQIYQAQEKHKREVRSLQEEIVDLTSRLKETRVEASEKRNQHEQLISQLRSQVQDIESQLYKKTNELEKIRTDYTKASTRAETLERSLHNTDSEFAAVAQAVQNMCYSG